MKDFSNLETREAYLSILCDWIEENPANPLAYAREWQEIDGVDAVEQLARQLRKDVCEYYGAKDRQNTMVVLIQSALRRVRWREIANELIRLCQPRPVDAEE